MFQDGSHIKIVPNCWSKYMIANSLPYGIEEASKLMAYGICSVGRGCYWLLVAFC
jgi:hypothetical protein